MAKLETQTLKFEISMAVRSDEEEKAPSLLSSEDLVQLEQVIATLIAERGFAGVLVEVSVE